jgi:hypothetical protein
MDIKTALIEQNRAALAMLADCVRLCPDDLWMAGEPAWRAYWRIAFHAAYFAHLYLGQNQTACGPWANCPTAYQSLWGDEEPYELSVDIEPMTQESTLDYIAFIDNLVASTVEALDLDSDDTGFPWYPNMSKLSHELMSLRHLQGHIGQLSELLMTRGIDTEWIGKP